MEKTFDLKVPAARAEGLDLSALLDAEKLLHLHPHWTVDEFRKQENGFIVASLTDYETDNEFEINLRLDFDASAGQNNTESKTVLRITLIDFVVNEILFFTEHDQMQVRISGDSEEFDEEIEKNIFLWVRSIQEYLRLYTTSKPTALFFRLVMNQMVLKMNPPQRKISLMIAKITVVEVLVIVVIVAGYFLFGQ